MSLIDFLKFLIFMLRNKFRSSFRKFTIGIGKKYGIIAGFTMKTLRNQVAFFQQIKHTAIADLQ